MSTDVATLEGTPAPFGRIGSGRATTLNWWHNLYSFVAEGRRIYVRDLDGVFHVFAPCGPGPCFNAAGFGYENQPGRLQTLESTNSIRYRLYMQDGTKVEYGDAGKWEQTGSGYVTKYFVTRIRTKQDDALATVNYASPTNVTCPNPGPTGAPYISTVSLPNGANFAATWRLNASQCILDHLDASNGDRLLTFAYLNDAPGQISTVTYGPTASPAKKLQYDYTSTSPYLLTTEKIVDGSNVITTNTTTYDSASGRVTGNTYAAETLASMSASIWTASRSYPAGARVEANPSNGHVFKTVSGGTSGTTQPTWNTATGGTTTEGTGLQWTEDSKNFGSVVNSSAGDGSGGTLEGGVVDTYAAEDRPSGQGLRTTSVSTTCASSPACSPGTTEHNWLDDTNTSLNWVASTKDKRNNYDVSNRSVSSSSGQVELTSMKRGCSNGAGANALESIDFSYDYSASSEQRKVAETRATLKPGATDSVGKVWTYDSSNRVTAEILSGYTKGLNGVWDTSLSYTATFYRYSGTVQTGCPSLTGSSYRVEGPCPISGPTSTACAGTTPVAPVVDYVYYSGAGQVPVNRRNQLNYIRRYTAGCSGASGTYYTTTFNDYDAYGNVTSQTDENGNTTSFAWGGADHHQMTSKTIGGLTTNYTYEKGVLVAMQLPAGDYEVYCYRSGTSPGSGCTGGTWTTKLQWKAKSSNATATTWSERVDYQYVNGLMSQAQYGSPSKIYKTVKYAADAHGRPTLETLGVGTGSNVIKTPRRYDGADNVVNTGLPYNSPSDLCWSSGAPSANCSAMNYDAANRITEIVERPSGSEVRSCFSYDTNGNVTKVIAGCKTATPCGAVGFPSDCSSMSNDYQWDDFGNLVESNLANVGGTSKESIRYAYKDSSTACNGGACYRNVVMKKQTPTQRFLSSMAATGYTYDPQGRVTVVTDIGNGTSTDLYRQYYDSYPNTLPTGCSSPVNSAGRLAAWEDSFGVTIFQYDAEGRVTKEARIRTGTTSCSGASVDLVPSTSYEYTSGRLTKMFYPHGREVRFNYKTSPSDRVDSIDIVLQNATVKTLLSNATWEPYGGLEAYDVLPPNLTNTPTAIEYLTGGDASVTPILACNLARPSGTSDETDRLRAIWVSRAASVTGALSTRTGSVYQRTYTWDKDQISVQDSCLLPDSVGPDVPRREVYTSGYDQSLRLRTASRPTGNFASTGGAFDTRTYYYDPASGNLDRGNRREGSGATVGETLDGCSFTYAYDSAAHLRDRLTQRKTTCTSDVENNWTWDLDGRVQTKAWHEDSSMSPAQTMLFNYNRDSTHGDTSSVFRSVQIDNQDTSVYSTSKIYDYYYDPLGRRRAKIYPNTKKDEFFYSASKELIEDIGNCSLTGTCSVVPINEYIWLDGRAVAFVRTNFDASTWARQPDLTGTCSRNGDGVACGAYFVVTDHIKKPVLILDSNGKVAGAADYDPFGHPNRVSAIGNTTLPYYSNNTVGQTIATLDQKPGRNESVRLRARFHLVDTEGASWDRVYFKNSAGTTLDSQRIGGLHKGAVVSDWVNVPTTPNSQILVKFDSDSSNCCALASGGIDCAGPCSWCPNYQATCNASNFGYRGIALESYEYQRYENVAGVTPVWTPLRFPGQYWDAETDLFENWNRYYEPATGRYLQRDPIAETDAKRSTHSTYSYADIQPLVKIDPSGLFELVGDCPNFYSAIDFARLRAGCSSDIGGETDKTCACQGAIDGCNKGCDICQFLDASSPPVLIPMYSMIERKGSSAAHGSYEGSAENGTRRVGPIRIAGILCSDPIRVWDLAGILIHEAAHACVDVTQKETPDKGDCSAYALSDRCMLGR